MFVKRSLVVSAVYLLCSVNNDVSHVLLQVYTYKQNALTRQKVQPMHHSSIRGVEDMATLEDLHDGAIMHNLFLRYQQRHIYVSDLNTVVLQREGAGDKPDTTLT